MKLPAVRLLLAEIVKIMAAGYRRAILLTAGFFCLATFDLESHRTPATVSLGPVAPVIPAFTGALNGLEPNVRISGAE